MDLDNSLYNEESKFISFATRGNETKWLWNLIWNFLKLACTNVTNIFALW